MLLVKVDSLEILGPLEDKVHLADLDLVQQEASGQQEQQVDKVQMA